MPPAAKTILAGKTGQNASGRVNHAAAGSASPASAIEPKKSDVVQK